MTITCTDLGFITGEKSANRTDLNWAVGGTDLGIMWDNGRGAVCTVFGDTYNPRNSAGGAGGGDWRHNVLGFTSDHDLNNGLTFDLFVNDAPGHARQIIPDNSFPGYPTEVTTIPTGGCMTHDGRQYLTYMSIRDWGSAGVWHTNYAGFAYSDDGGTNWVKDSNAWWPNNANGTQKFQMCALVPNGVWLYIFGTQNGRRGPAYLARVPQNSVLDLSQHRQWDGNNWVQNADAAVPIVNEQVSELSVMYHSHSKRFLMLYLNDVAGKIVMHDAPTPVGPWSGPTTVLTATDYPALYGGYWHPWTMDDPNPCFVFSQWGDYNSRLMRVNLGGVHYQPTRVPLSTDVIHPYN